MMLSTHSDTYRPQIIMFDMDGTLLDLAFDDYIWLDRVPRIWAQQQQCDLAQAYDFLKQFYQKYQGTLDWYSTAFWQQQLDINVLDLQIRHRERIQARPYCFELLAQLQQRRIECWIVTNADCNTLNLKLQQIPLQPYFRHCISSEQIGFPKEDRRFWQILQQRFPFEPQQCMFIDDNYAVLDSARQFGIGQLFSISEPNSAQPRTWQQPQYRHLQRLDDLLQYLEK